MNIFEKVKNAITWRKEEQMWTTLWGADSKSLYDHTENSEITYFICLKILSEAVGKLSIHLYDSQKQKIHSHDAIARMASRPNPFMTPADFKKLMEYNRNHFGNAYAYIQYDRAGKLASLIPLEPDRVKVLIDDKPIFSNESNYIYQYKYKDKTYYFSDKEILHLKGGMSRNGIVGRSIAEDLASTINGAKESQKYLNDLYERGLAANAVLQYTGDLNEANKRSLLSKISEFARSSESGNIIPIPLGMDLKPLDIKLRDAQFIEIKKFTSLQIAAAFGIKPNHLNDYEKSSYANSEIQNLTFYIDTLLIILQQWEEELNYKLLSEEERAKGYEFIFNVSKILKGDSKTQAEALRNYVTSSIYTINEARKYVNLPPIENGDVIITNGSYTSLEDLGKAYGGDTNDSSEE